MEDRHDITIIVKYNDIDWYTLVYPMKTYYLDELLGDKLILHVMEQMLDALKLQIKAIRRNIKEWPEQLEVSSSSLERLGLK